MPLRGGLLLGARCWRRRAWGWATLPRPVPRQAPTRERPYGEGAHEGSPLRFVSEGARTVLSHAGKTPLRGGCGGFPFSQGSIFITMTMAGVDSRSGSGMTMVVSGGADNGGRNM